MTQKVKLDFIITASSAGVQSELNRLNKSLNAMAASAKGPQAVNHALRQQMQLHEANINAIAGHAAAIKTLNSVSQTFSASLRNGGVASKDALRSLGSLTKVTKGFSNEIKQVAKQQLQFQSAGFTPFLKDMDGRITGVSRTTDGFTSSMSKATRQAMQMRMEQFLATKQIQSFGQNLVKMGKNAQWTGRQITMGFTMPMAVFMGLFAAAAHAVDKQVTRILKVYDFGVNNTKAAQNELAANAKAMAFDISQSYGFATQETLNVMAEFAQQGRRGSELMQMTQETMRTAFLGDVDTDNASRLIRMLESAADIANGINIRPALNEVVEGTENATRSFQDLNEVLNRFNVLENSTVITVAELAEELPDLVGTLNSLNLSVEFGAAALTAMKEAGLNVNESQTALRVGLQRLISPTEKASRVFQEMTGKDLNALAEGATSAEDVILELADTLRELDNFNAKADVLSAIFGNRQSGRLSLLFDQIGEEGSAFAEAISITGGFDGEEGVSALEAYRTALQETQLVQESMSGKLDRAKAAFGALSAQLGTTFLPMLTTIVNVGKNIVAFFDAWPEALKKGVVVLTVVAGLFGLGIQIFGTFANLLGSVVGAFTRLMGLGINKHMRDLGLVTRVFANSEEVLQHKMSTTNAVIAQQTEQMTRLQAAMAAAKGHILTSPTGAAMGSRGQQENAKMALQQKLRRMALTEEKAIAATRAGSISSLQKEDALNQKNLATLDAQLAKIKLSKAELSRRLEISIRDQALAEAKYLATEKELQAKIKLKQIDLAGMQAKLKELQGSKQTAVVKKQIETITLKIAEAEGTIARYATRITSAKHATANAAAKHAAATKAVQRAEWETNKSMAGSTAWKIKSLKEDMKRLGIEKQLRTLIDDQELSHTRIERIKRSIAARDAESLRTQLKELAVSKQKLAAEQAETVEEQKQSRLRRMGMTGRGVGRAGGIGAAGMGLAFAAQGVMGEDNPWGGVLSGAVTGAMTGMMVGGPLGAVVGLGVAAASAAGPLQELGREFGILGDKIDPISTSMLALQEALEVPLNINPFEGTVHGVGSLARQQEFEQSERFTALTEKYGTPGVDVDLGSFDRDIVNAVTRALMAGIDADEVRAEFQTALDAMGSELDLDEIIFDFEVTPGRPIEDIAADFIGNLEDLMGRGGVSAGQNLAEGFDLTLQAFAANQGEVAAEAIGTVFDEAWSAVNTDSVSTVQEMFGVTPEDLDLLERNLEQAGGSLEQLQYLLLSQTNTDHSEEGNAAAASAQKILDAITQLEAEGASDAEIVAYFNNAGDAARETEALIEDFAARMGLNLDKAGEPIETLTELFTVFATDILGQQGGEAFLDNMIIAQQEFGRGLRSGTMTSQEYERAVLEQAYALTFLSESARHGEDAIRALTEEEQNFVNAFTSNYRGLVNEAFAEAGDALIQPSRDALEAEMEIWDDRLEAQQDFHDETRKAQQNAHGEVRDEMQDRHKEESRLFGLAQEAQTDALKEQLDEQLDAFDKQTEEMEKAARDGADARIKALDDEEEAINELDRKRELAYEREKRRQEYFINLRNTSVSLAVALASGDVESATQLRGELDTNTSDYMNSMTEEGLEEQRRTEEANREESRRLIEEELEAELTRIETTRDTEREALQGTHELRMAQLQEEQRLAQIVVQNRQEAEMKALQTRQEAEQAALQRRLEGEREALQEQMEHSRLMGQARISAHEEALQYAIQRVNPTTIEEWGEVVDVMNERLVSQGEGGFVGAVEAAGDTAGGPLAEKLHLAVQTAGDMIAGDLKWEDFGAEIADAIATGAFNDLPIDGVEDLIGWINGTTAPFDNTPTTPGEGGPTVRHSGGTIHGGLPSARGLGPDERPIIAQTGEYMIQRKAVQKLGVPFLESINRGDPGDGMRFHSGGFIGMMAAATALPIMGLIRAMGEGGGRAMTPEGVSGFASAFGTNPGGVSGGAGSEALALFMEVIKQQESGGNYSIFNYDARNGPAWGAYQFIPGTWNGAVQQALGSHVQHGTGTPAQQDAVAAYLMGEYFRELQSWQAVAAAWYGGIGRGRLWNSNPNDPYFNQPQGGYPTVREYINSIVARMGASGGMPGGAGFGPFYGGYGGSALDEPMAYGTMPMMRTPGLSYSSSFGPSGLPANVKGASDLMRASFPLITGHGYWRNDPDSDHDTSKRKAVDYVVGTIGRYPTDPALINQGWGIANWHIMNPDAFGTKYVIYRGMINNDGRGWRNYQNGKYEGDPRLDHFDHVHVSYLHDGGLVNPKMPQLMTGGKIKYDNTIANLHRGEMVLTQPLTEELERGIRSISNSSTINIYPSPGMDEERFAALVIRKLETRDRLRGERPTV